MGRPLKNIITAIIRWAVFCVPWGVREAITQACIDRSGARAIGARLFPRLNIVELGVPGDRGIITSAWNDTGVLPEYAETGTFARSVTSALVDFFGAGGGTYIDIGANIGLTTIPVARNPLVRCIAFEPEPLNFSFLKRNVARNAADGTVDFQQVALYHSRGIMSLAVADGNIGDHRLTQGEIPGRQTVEISTLLLDDFLDKIVEPLAIKIDTQGAEPSILAGGRKVVAKAGLLAMEFCPFLIEQLGGDPNVVIDLLSDFDRVAIMQGGVAESPIFDTSEVAQRILRRKLETARPTDDDYLDIMAVRSARAAN